MVKATVLLGAGASMDAGLPSAFSLTTRVYDELCASDHKTQSVLFGYIVSKLLSRRVLSGGSPFDPINIEEVYDALLRLLDRDSDTLSEFVYSWDPILDHMKPQFSEENFIRGIVEGLADQNRSRSGMLSINAHGLRKAARAISAALGARTFGSSATQTAALYIDILVKILANPTESTDYLEELVSYCGTSGSSLATLNYDLLVEHAGQRQDVAWDYGLSTWERDRIVTWRREGNKLLKLHGSINWSGTNDAIVVSSGAPEVSRWSRSNALLIFGGQSGKLTPNGPFLQLRHEFERNLLKSNRLLIVGYSFADNHINSILARWVATRRRGKLVIVDPGQVNFGLDVFRHSYRSSENDLTKLVDIVHVKKTARRGMSDAIRNLQARIDLSHDRKKNGFLPHIMVKMVE